MHCDEYGQERPGRWCIKINIFKILDLWRRFRHPKKPGWAGMCKEAKKRDAEFEAWRSRPIKE